FPTRRSSDLARGAVASDDIDHAAVAQFVDPFDDDGVAGLQPLLNHYAAGLGIADAHLPDFHAVVGIDAIDEVAARAALHGIDRYQHDIAQRIDLHAHIHELIGEQRITVVAELRL